MEQYYKDIMKKLGYESQVCEIFSQWENVKDEILPQDRKSGSGNGTIHVFLGNADNKLREEFADYYQSVDNGEDPSNGAIEVTHYFLYTNIMSMIGSVCAYYNNQKEDFTKIISDILAELENFTDDSGLIETTSLLKLSTGSNKLRPYFKQFDSHGAFTKLVRKLLLPNSAYKITLFKNSQGKYAAIWLIGFQNSSDFEVDSNKKKIQEKLKALLLKESLQQITYGAPGTGKSFGLKDLINSMSHFRTTFHPDSDYASFVGAYKPTMSKVQVQSGYNTLDEGNKTEEEQIAYRFVPQSFIKAYVSAWKNYAAEKSTVLVIEEINRGNCAQIFGDLFQLLDRDKSGFSSYPIEADADVALYLNGAMKDVNLGEQASAIDELFADSYPNGITDKIKSGELLLLPNNLYIWATMNTSDQSLFPIDSAFKRRWDWKFIKIADAHKGWFIQFGNEGCDWWTFISKMNKLIAKETSSDDKKMGYFFCKPQSEDEKVITEDQFVGKVLFYLWNDVFKDGETALFNVSDDTDDEPTFEAFYNDDNTPNVEAIRKFIVKVVGEENIVGLDKDDYGKTSVIDRSKYSFDGNDKLPKTVMGLRIVEKYIKEHANDTFDNLKAAFSFGETKDDHLYYGVVVRSEEVKGYQDCYTDQDYTSADGVKFRIFTYWNKHNKHYILDFAKQQGWEVKETESE